jgi:ABC-type sugar transport system permease subunit
MGRVQRQRIIGDWLLMAPQLILFVGLTLVPFIIAIPMLFTDQLSFQDVGIESAGLSNFTRLFTDPNIQAEYLPALKRTVLFVTFNYLMVYVFGLTLALLIYEIGFHGWFFTIVYLPMMVSGLAIGYMATMLFARSTGTVNLMLGQWFGVKNAIDIQNPSFTAVMLPVMIGWRYAGFNVAIFLAGLLAIPIETIEAATVDGASCRGCKHLFPQMPSFIIASIFCLIGSLGYSTADPLGAGQREARISLCCSSPTHYFTASLWADADLQTFLPLVIVALLLQRLQQLMRLRPALSGVHHKPEAQTWRRVSDSLVGRQKQKSPRPRREEEIPLSLYVHDRLRRCDSLPVLYVFIARSSAPRIPSIASGPAARSRHGGGDRQPGHQLQYRHQTAQDGHGHQGYLSPRDSLVIAEKNNIPIGEFQSTLQLALSTGGSPRETQVLERTGAQ